MAIDDRGVSDGVEDLEDREDVDARSPADIDPLSIQRSWLRLIW